MMRRPWFPRFAALFLAAGLGAQSLSDQGVIPLSSPIYGALDAVYRERGFARPSLARPWTTGQAKGLVGGIDRSGLSDAGLKTIEWIEACLEPKNGESGKPFAFAFKPSLSPEFYAHLPLGGDPGATDENYRRMHGYEDRQSLLRLPFELSFQEAIWLFSEVAVKEERDTVDSTALVDGGFPEGVTDNRFNLVFDDPSPRPDLYTPFRALTSVGGSFWNFRLGRDQLNWGNGHSGNLLLSDSSDFYDFAMIGFNAGGFSLTSVYASMDPYLANGAREDYHAFMGHRFEFAISKRFMVAVSESVAFGGTAGDSEADLVRDLNFLMIFHDWMIPERSNSLLSVEFSANPWKYLNVYAQVAMDELATEYEEERGGGGGPGIFGWLGGVDASVPVGDGYLDAGLEVAVTSPWLYNRRAAPYYSNVRRYWSLTTDRFEYVDKPIGYEYGPDSLVLYGDVSYGLPGRQRGGLDATLLLDGEKSLASAWDPVPGDLPPSGIAEGNLALHAFLDWPIAAWLSARGDVDAGFIWNRDHARGQWRNDLELSVSLTARLP